MSSDLLVVPLFFLLVITAFAIIRLRDLFAAVMLTSMMSLLVAGLFMVMDAVDVAFTEAAVGAGISTVLMLATLAITQRREKRRRRKVEPVPLALCLIAGGLLIYGTLDMPAYGDPEAPIHNYMAPRFLEDSVNEVGPPNIVTSVLASYRGFDTFGETTVVFAAAVGVLLLLGRPLQARRRAGADRAGRPGPRRRPRRRRQGRETGRGGGPVRRNRILRVSAKTLVPLIMIFGLYVQFHGDYGPGGGFQAGVIFAAAVVLYALVFGLRSARRAISPRSLEILVAAGVLLYGSVGLLTMLLGGNFLSYNTLAHDPLHGQHYGILFIELGVGLAVAAVMILLFYLFAGRGLRPATREAHEEGAP
ncbi:MAG: DUF4040 domain-containing protein [Acidobacteriota bacterium]